MSIASRIQEIETHIGNAYTSMDNLGIDISNTNKNIYNISTLLDTFYENLPKVSGIGASLSLSPSLRGKIKLNEIQGDTLQDGTPTPSSPVPMQSVTGLQNVGVCGKNIFNMVTAVQSTYGYHNNTGTLTHEDNNTIKIVKGNTSTDARMSVANKVNISSGTTINVSWEYGTGNGNVVGQIQALDTSGNVVNLTSLNNSGISSPQTITLSTNIKYIWLGTAWNNHSDLVVKNIQIEVGSTATTYEPYKGNTYEVNLGNIELNKIGDYKDSIKKSTGKNLFDKDNAIILNASINAANSVLSSNSNFRTLIFNCEPNTTYTVSKIASTRFNCALYNDYITSSTILPITLTDLIYNPTGTSITITTKNDTKCIAVMYYNSGTDTLTEEQIRNSIMINEGSTALPYEPYGNVWYIHKETESVNLNSLTWVQETSANSKRYASTGIQSKVLRPSSNGTTINTLCDIYVKNNASWTWNTTSGRGLAIQTNGQLIIFDGDYTGASDLTNFTTMLNNKVPKLIYPLATPTYTTITNTELIEQLESLYNAKSKNGTTNINVTSEDLSMLLNVGVLKGE